MDSEGYRKLVKDMERNIVSLQQIGLNCRHMKEKTYWDNLIGKEMYRRCILEEFIRNMERWDTVMRQNKSEEKVFTLEELSKYTGKNGMPAYIAVNGIVYDITFEAAWAAGTHFGLTAGKDLSNEFKSCHNVQTILDKLKKVGVLQK